jgi:uncharacterized membrane protein YjjP (DUF1212 family)
MTEELLYCTMELGEKLLLSGAEVSRVEESITRICRAYDAERVDVYATTANMIVTVKTGDGRILTQTRRVSGSSTDIEKLDALNNLSRFITAKKPCAEEIYTRLNSIKDTKQYNHLLVIFCYALIAGSFTIFFGARTVGETLASFLIGGIIGAFNMFGERFGIQKLMLKLLCSFFACSLAFLSVKLPFIPTVDNIIIGNVMSLIPGIGLTNALRDLFTGDVLTGILRSIEAALLGLVIAAGYIIAAFMLGGVGL